MRKFIFTLLSLFAANAAMAQHPITGAEAREVKSLPAMAQKTNTVDTITTYLDRATAYYILTAGSSGYVLGTNPINTEIGNHYDGLGSTTVTELMVFFVAKEIMGGVDSVTAKWYSCAADSMPLTLHGLGKASMADADTSGFPTFIPVSSTGPVTGDFFVSVDFAGIDDSLAFFSTNPTSGSGGPDGNGEKRGRANTAQGWLRLADIWTIGGNAYDADVLILPIVDFTPVVGVNPGYTTKGLTVQPAAPSPATSYTAIRFSLDREQEVALVVMDARGRIVQDFGTRTYAAGDHAIEVPTADLAAGTYYYTFGTAQTRIGSKFVVVK